MSKKIDKTTQNESQFQGIYLADSMVKRLWILAFLGPVGLIYPLIISKRKEVVSKGRKEYYYSEFSRNKAEGIAVFSIMMTVIYAVIVFLMLVPIE